MFIITITNAHTIFFHLFLETALKLPFFLDACLRWVPTSQLPMWDVARETAVFCGV